MKILKLSYIDEFSCIGPECTDSCCKNWTITLTKKEYLDYKKIECSSELKKIISAAFKRIRSEKESINAYVHMRLREDGSCPFLGDDSLCMLQKELGAGVLSTTCSVFPRLNLIVGEDTIIKTLTATCPHVVELMIKHPEGLSIQQEEYDGKDKFINKKLFGGGVIPFDWEGMKNIWIFKSTQLGILQNRNFSITERLLILGYFSSKAEEYITDKGKMQTLSAAMLDNSLCRNIADSLNAKQNDGQAGTKTLNIISEIKNLIDNTSSIAVHIKELYEKKLEKIQLELRKTFLDGKTVTKFSCNFDAMMNYFQKFRQIENERPYIFENILVNMVFGETPNKGIWMNYFILVVYYNLMKVLIPASLPENFSDRDLAQAVTDVTKLIINTKFTEKQVYNHFKTLGISTLPYTVFLLKE